METINTYDFGHFGVDFAAEVLDGKSAVDAVFDVSSMWTHLIHCLKNQNLAPFLKCKVWIVTFKKLLILGFRLTWVFPFWGPIYILAR